MLVLPADLTRAQASACMQMLAQGLRALSGTSVVVDAGALERVTVGIRSDEGGNCQQQQQQWQ